MIVASLWVGGPLGVVQEICLSSFIYHRHTVYLYVYDMDMVVPDGVNKLDANLIMSESEIFYHKGQLASFADLFRYKMIKQTGMMWVDADTICFTDKFFDSVDTVFIAEIPHKQYFANGILKLPQDSPILSDLIDQAEEILKDINDSSYAWAAIGPALLSKLVIKHKLEKFGVDVIKTNLFASHHHATKFWNPKHTRQILKLSQKCYSGTFYNGYLNMIDFDKESIVPDSAIEYFYKKFVLAKPVGV